MISLPLFFHSSKRGSFWDRFPTSQPLLDALTIIFDPESINPFSVDVRKAIAVLPESWRIRYRCPGLMMVSGSSWPEENLTEPRGVASPIDIVKKRTDPTKNASSHAAGRDTGSTGGCAPRANKKVPSVTKSNQVMERVAIALLTCGGLARFPAARNSVVGYIAPADSSAMVYGRYQAGRNMLSPNQANTMISERIREVRDFNRHHASRRVLHSGQKYRFPAINPTAAKTRETQAWRPHAAHSKTRGRRMTNSRA